MALPSKTALSQRIKSWVESQKSLNVDESDPAQSFADGLAEIILQVMSEAEVKLVTTNVTTNVVGSSATGGPVVGQGTGSGIQNNSGVIV